ncbi:glycosyltransferase [Robertmurraya sp. FSL R5-0851]|uniref:glycosyltransferase n=1 Tax=Robertmurraya sp. FSL R5-0851 TaxID=2921584 RepID=UPI0030F64AEA
MKNVLIASFDLEVGGVERSLISMLENFNYTTHNVDLMLYRQQGDFLSFIPYQVNLLEEIKEYSTYRKSIKEIFKEGQMLIGISRILAKFNSDLKGKMARIEEPGYIQMQLMWKYALPFLPELKKEYDVAISYLWPHYFVANKVKARKKIAWIHTDYSIIETNIKLDLEMWSNFDHIIAVSEGCKDSFLHKYPELSKKVMVMENIASQEYIMKMAEIKIDHPMFDDNHFRIVTVARLSHAKGIDNAVRAMKKLRDKGFKDICWYVVGYGGEEEMLRELIIKLNLEKHFFLLGKQINPYPFIKHADLYVQPSRYEGKAVTVVEAQILKKPVVITNYSTAKSQVTNGFDGLIVELSEEGITNGIINLYKDKKRREELSYNCTSYMTKSAEEIQKLYSIM